MSLDISGIMSSLQLQIQSESSQIPAADLAFLSEFADQMREIFTILKPTWAEQHV